MEQTRTLEQLIDAAAAEGRVRRRAQHDNVDLPSWSHRRETRATSLAHVVATALLLAGPSLLVQACTLVPDGRSMRTELDRTQLIHNANQIIEQL